MAMASVPLSAMSHDGFGKYILRDQLGIYLHDEESASDFRDGQRIAVFEPATDA